MQKNKIKIITPNPHEQRILSVHVNISKITLIKNIAKNTSNQ